MQPTNDTTTTPTATSIDALIIEHKIARQSEREAEERQLRIERRFDAERFDKKLIDRLGPTLCYLLNIIVEPAGDHQSGPHARFTFGEGRFTLYQRFSYDHLGDVLSLHDDTPDGAFSREIQTHDAANQLIDALADYPDWREQQKLRRIQANAEAIGASQPAAQQPKHRYVATVLTPGMVMRVCTDQRNRDGERVSYTGTLDAYTDSWVLLSMANGDGQRMIHCNHILAIVPEPPKAPTPDDDGIPF